MDSETISIEEIFQILKKKWKLVIILPLITTAISIFYSFYIVKPQYEACTKVFVGKETADKEKYDNNDVEMYQKLLKTYSELAKTNTLVSKALKEHNIDLQSSAVLNALTTIPTANTQILEIRYINLNKSLAKDTVSAITDEFIKETQELIPDSTVKVIEDVVISETLTSSKKRMYVAIGFIIGLMLSFGIIFLIEFLDYTFKDKEKLERIVQLPTFGIIPDDTKVRKIKNHITLIVEKKPKSIVAEAYRTLITNILYSESEKTIKTILVTSSKLQEGKSTVAGNLALSFAENDKKVIIVDCDLRKPSLHEKFNISNTSGLSDVILKRDSLDNVIQKHNKNLYVISSGKFTEKPASMLASQTMDDILTELNQKYDIILLDSPPAQAVTDAQILSSKVDCTLIVIRSGLTNAKSVLETKSLLTKVSGLVIGTVLHRTEYNKDTYYYRSHGSSNKTTRSLLG
ncbi:capsular exopolysaccharide family [Clostridium sp. DL-VIII]|uniref:polysaccharide biosynthesis tyrosine autokinase n=1 Tax=Clostridium sp. DL-VIII TaxID=641107 RepID=UPI00023AFC94|nr:polysaccharide biosynthesis tyrosine autokinase [Clostridium sp. DL-VIII]EHI98337.1 capsular exopolysaccharide family [Clostridium sp. DL-VIII]